MSNLSILLNFSRLHVCFPWFRPSPVSLSRSFHLIHLAWLRRCPDLSAVALALTESSHFALDELHVTADATAAAFLVLDSAVGFANPGHPRFVAFPSTCSFASHSSYFEVVGEVFSGSSIDAPASDAPCSHFSSRKVSFHKKKGLYYNRPNLCHSYVRDTSDLPMDATTSRYRKRFLLERPGQHKHMFPEEPPAPAVPEI